MDLGTIILLEMMFLEILIFILLLIFGSKPREKINSEFQVIEIKKEPKRNLKEQKKEHFHEIQNKKILKKKTGEFERFLSLLIPLAIIAYLLFSNYTGIHFDLLTIILLFAGILIVSVLIFFELTKKYRR